MLPSLVVAASVALAAPPPSPSGAQSNLVDAPAASTSWSAQQLEVLRSLSLLALTDLAPDPTNAVADDPRAAAFGAALFFDTRLSRNGEVSCATCHRPERAFADSLAKSVGVAATRRNAPALIGAAHQRWFYWDGRRDSQWAQALTPLEHADEHGLSRVEVVAIVAADARYRAMYKDLFGEPVPDVSDGARFPPQASPLGERDARDAWQRMTPADRDLVNIGFARVGKVLAAYQRTLEPTGSRFDHYVAALLAGDATGGGALSAREQAGLALFIGERAQCTRCHNGPLFTNGDFHNIGLVKRTDVPLDTGREAGVRQVRADPFNCLGIYSDAHPDQCAELTYMKTSGIELVGAFKVPSLRNVSRTAPYMHDGRFSSLEAVIAHYVAAPTQVLGHQDLEPLRLDGEQIGALLAFLRALEDIDPGAVAANPDQPRPASDLVVQPAR